MSLLEHADQGQVQFCIDCESCPYEQWCETTTDVDDALREHIRRVGHTRFRHITARRVDLMRAALKDLEREGAQA